MGCIIHIHTVRRRRNAADFADFLASIGHARLARRVRVMLTHEGLGLFDAAQGDGFSGFQITEELAITNGHLPERGPPDPVASTERVNLFNDMGANAHNVSMGDISPAVKSITHPCR